MALDRSEREKLIQQYADGPVRLRAALAAVPQQALRWRPRAGEWSAHEVVCHCADSEANSYSRIRYVIAEKEPTIVGYDQDNWARVFDYHARPLEPALAVVEAVCASTAAMIRGLPEEMWRRFGHHTERSHYTAEDWLRFNADHLEVHARQIEANVAAWYAASGR